MLRVIMLLAIMVLPMVVKGQSWQQVYDDVMATDDDDEAGELLDDSYELLEQLASHPFDLNHASREDLEQLPFLSTQQVMDLMEYLYRYGPMHSMGELRMIRSLDYPQVTLLPFFAYIADEEYQAPDKRPSFDSLLHRGESTLTATTRLPLYKRKGDKDGYLGYRYRHSLRYEWSSGDYLQLGLIGAQDAGEPFFADKNRWGYDTYSYYLQVKKLGRLEQLIAGKYKFSAGMGLVLGQSFQLGKLATLQSLGRTMRTIRPHSSRSESDYFQGVAAAIRLWQPLTLSAFLSYRPMDATLNSAGDAQTLLTAEYHRTPTEMAKKNNTHLTSSGTHLTYHQGALTLGATAVTTGLDRELQPQRQTLYRRHYAHGSRFTNISADYSYTHYRLSLSGETAVDGQGHLATINAISLQPTARLSTMALQRFYSYRYTTLYGHSFGEGTSVQNESGIYLGATWNPLAHLRLQGYADYAYFPWAKYQVSQTSHAWDFLMQGTYELSNWTFLVRHRSRLQQKDNDEKTALIANNDHRERLSVAYSNNTWQLKTQLDLAYTDYKESSQGWMVSQQASFSRPKLLLSAIAAYFNTDSYQSRIYIYERQLQHEFSFPTYSGEGIRIALQTQADLGRRLRLAAKIGYVNYFDRNSISSGLQEIDQSHQTDIDLQLRWKF